jgi:hypothetical protein
LLLIIFAVFALPYALFLPAASHPSPVVQAANKTRIGKEGQPGVIISTTGVHLHHLVGHINSLCKQKWMSVSRQDAVKEDKDLFVSSYSFQSVSKRKRTDWHCLL